MTSSPTLRRTRIVCISDTHNSPVKLPEGDVLIHAGDLTNQGSYSELSKSVKWLEGANFEAKIVIAGNHDLTLDEEFYSQYGHNFHNQNPQSSATCRELFASSPSITYLCHESTTVRLSSPRGPRTQFTVFGSPYSPRHGQWAFYYDVPTTNSSSCEFTKLWDDIPLDTDIVVTHTPPRTHCDNTDERRSPGCEALRRALWRVRPRLAVCGHIHDGRGAERVTWDLGNPNSAYTGSSVIRWNDPGNGNNNRLSLIDLTGRKAPLLSNDGSHPHHINPSVTHMSSGQDANQERIAIASVHTAAEEDHATAIGSPSLTERNQYALQGRMGRRETCIVNAAIMKSRYPHVGGKTFNKPIVVDINLPVCDDEEK